MSRDNPNTKKFPLCNIQAAYFVGEQSSLPLATTAQFYREIEFEAFSHETIERALRTLIARHPMLRTIATEDGSQQVLEGVEPYAVMHHDMRGLDEAAQQARYDAIRSDLIGLTLPTDSWPQFCFQSSSDGVRSRLHIRVNLWMIDATSVQVLTGELLQLCHFPQQALAPVPASFREYVETTLGNQDSDSAKRAKAYWRERLSTLPLGPSLPLACSAEEVGKPNFVHLTNCISAADWSRLIALGAPHRLSVNSVMLAAFAAVIARWSQKRHFTLTLLVSRRAFAGEEFAGVVGNFGSTVLLEIAHRSSQSFVEFAASIQKQIWTDIRFMEVSGIEVGREMNRFHGTPLGLVAPVAFTSIGPGGDDDVANPKALRKVTQRYSHLEVPQVYLDHQVVEEPQGHVTLNWDYVAGLWLDGVPQAMFGAYTDLVRTLATRPDTWAEPLTLPLPQEQRDLLDTYNRTAWVLPDLTLDDLVWNSFASHPSRPAVIQGELTLSYAELAQQVDVLRHRLAGSDVQSGQLIGVMLPKGWQQIVAVLAICRSGCAYVPIDPDLPTARRTALIEQACITVVVSSAELARRAELPAGVACIRVDAEAPAPVALAAPSHSPDRLAYVIFTSGSTGVPKGVMIDHGGAVNTILDLNRRLGTACGDRVLALSSLSFDLSVYDVFGILGAGGTIVVPAADEVQSPEAWARLVNRHGVTIWNSVPALFQLVVDSCAQDGVTLPSLRHVLMSGDWIPRKLPEQGAALAANARFFSLGGATEASIWSVIHEIAGLDDSWRTIPYGKPLANQQLLILDEALEECPVWKSGELYIGGRGLALAYFGAPQKTSERFILHPRTGQRLYRTGDMARMRPDGNVEFLGREDHQIKIRGFRIELGEIESVLVRHADVLAAVAKVSGSDHASKRLVCFVVSKPGATVTDAGLKTWLGSELPRYMVPEQVHLLNALPLTPNGKVDHRALESLCTRSGAPDDAAPARTHGELDNELVDALNRIWQEVLGCKDIDPGRSFFALGGTSFLALQLVAKIRKRFGVRLGLADISATMSLDDMAALLVRQRPRSADGPRLIKLREAPHAGAPTVVCVHPVGGSAHCYIPLANSLAVPAQVVGIQAAPAGPEAAASIERMAEQYADLILSAELAGPYLLVGWSMGAAVAVELARELRVRGQRIAFVGLVDPYCAVPERAAAIDSCDLLAGFCEDLAGLAGRSWHWPDSVPRCAGDTDVRIFEELIGDMERRALLPPGVPTAELREVHAVFERNMRALLTYRPKPVEDAVTVFYANEILRNAEHYLRQWRPEAAAVDERSSASDHFTIVQVPAVQAVADVIDAHLHRIGNVS